MIRQNYIHIGSYNVDLLQLKINEIPLESWHEWTHKQSTYKAHEHTLTIPLLLDETYGRIASEKGTETKYYTTYKKPLQDIEIILNNFYGTGEIIRAELALLKAGKKVAEHIDSGESLTHNQRIHLPIVTNWKNTFTVNKEMKHLKVGEIYEIDNTGQHSVTNNSNTDRIHLILDYKKAPSALF